MTDLSFLSKKDPTCTLEIVHADTGEPIGVTFQVVPETSAVVFAAVGNYRDKIVENSIKGEETPPDVLREMLAAQLAACVVGWTSKNEGWNENVGDYTPDKAKAIFAAANHDKNASAIANQVRKFVGDAANFTKAPSGR